MFYDRLLERLEEMRDNSEGMQQWHSETELNDLRESRVFLFDTEQAEVFLHHSYPFENYPHFVFPRIFINFTRPLEVQQQGTEVVFHEHTRKLERLAAQRPSRYQGVMIRQTTVERLPEGLSLQDILNRRIVDEQADLISLQGCLSSWYEGFPRAEDDRISLSSFQLTFNPISFPYLANREIHEGFSTLRRAETFHRLTVNLLYFLSCENIEFRYRDPRSSREFLSSTGQSTRYPFYTIDFNRSDYRARSQETGTGTRHRFRYDVRGHFRHLRDQRYERNQDGTYKVIWVHPHQRGLANELYVPALRDVARSPIVRP